MLGLDGDKKASHPRDGGLSFGEIVGQRQLKRALLSVATDDDLDGLLIRGEKGTAKSTAVRALADLLPEQTAVADCPFGCHPDDPARQCSDCRDRTTPPTTERPVPLVTLPLGATRERVVGSLSVTDALDGNSEFDPGLLARANRGILYVDEVNLLDDHLVDVLLDAAASGVNRVERDGVSVAHPAEFTLVGTMNPEEGDLRPQLRDRFALQATVTGCEDIEQRVAIVDRALGRTERREEEEEKVEKEEDSPSEGRAETEDPAERLATARDLLDDVAIPTPLVEEVAELCRDSGAEGHRADIATVRAARTLAALDGRTEVVRSDARTAAELTLPHRLQSRPFEDAPDADELLDDHFEDDGADGDSSEAGEDGDDSGDSRESEGGDTRESEDDGDGGESEGDDGSDGGGSAETGDEDGDGEDGDGRSGSRGESERGESKNDGATSPSGASVDGESGEGTAEAPPDSGGNADGDAGDGSVDDGDADEERTPLVPGQSRAEVGDGVAPEVTAEAGDDTGNAGGGSPSRPSADADGPRVRTERADSPHRVDAAASVRAAGRRGGSSVESRDLRRSVRRGDSSALVVFAVDASASMRPAMRSAKGTVLELLKDAYQQRDEVAFVAFAGDGADVLLPPTDSVSLAARHLKELPTADRTPLPAALRTVREVLERADPAASVVVLVTDGRANVAEGSPVERTREAARLLAEFGTRTVVVDAGDGADRAGILPTVLDETDGERIPLSALSADRIDAAVGAVRGGDR